MAVHDEWIDGFRGLGRLDLLVVWEWETCLYGAKDGWEAAVGVDMACTISELIRRHER